MTQSQRRIRRLRILRLNRALTKLYPEVATELVYKTPWQFMVAVQLSAQTTDKLVNTVTPALFKRYKTIQDFAYADREELFSYIKRVNYGGNKVRNISNAAKYVLEHHKGKLPQTMIEMVKIPGVGRKTANVLLGDLHGVSEGITVDTHVIRFVKRYDLSNFKDAVRIERDLMEILPKKEWPHFTHRVIFYGRRLAPARKYDTTHDPLVKIYPPAAGIFRV